MMPRWTNRVIIAAKVCCGSIFETTVGILSNNQVHPNYHIPGREPNLPASIVVGRVFEILLPGAWQSIEDVLQIDLYWSIHFE
jgi:hypothetical protein